MTSISNENRLELIDFLTISGSNAVGLQYSLYDSWTGENTGSFDLICHFLALKAVDMYWARNTVVILDDSGSKTGILLCCFCVVFRQVFDDAQVTSS